MRSYLIRVGDALSQILNVTVFMGDNANESVSGRSYRQRNDRFWSWMRAAIDEVFSWFGVADHCERAYRQDLARASHTLRTHRE